MALLYLTVLFGLAGILNANRLECDIPPPLVVNSMTFRGLAGKWYFPIGATNSSTHQKMIAKTDNSFFYLIPLNETAFYTKEATRLGDKCHEYEETPFILSDDHTEFYYKGNLNAILRILFLIPNDVIMLDLWEYSENETSYSIFVNAQNKTSDKETVEKFKKQIECAGFTNEEIFITANEKDECPLKEDENKYKKELEKYWAKHQSEDKQKEPSAV